MNPQTINKAIVLLAAVAAESFAASEKVANDDKASPERVEEIEAEIDALILAIAKLPATSRKARDAKSQFANLINYGAPLTAEELAHTRYADRALAASVLADAIHASSNRKVAA